MEILMSGDIYLKKEPDYVDYSFSEIEQMQMEKQMLFDTLEMARKEMEQRIRKCSDISETKKEEFLVGANEELDKEIERLNKNESEMLEKGKPLYDEYKNFWSLICTDESLNMVEQTTEGPKKIKKYSNKEEMEKDFISLRELLKDAEYLGIEYFIPERIGGGLLMLAISMDGSQKSSGIIATYFSGDRAIVFNKKDNKFELALHEDIVPKSIGRRVLTNGEYKDKAELYQAIFKQLTKGKRNTL